MRCAMLVVGLVWLLGGSAVGQVNLPEGFEIVDFAVSDDFTDPPSINNCGQIVFGKILQPSWDRANIFLYDNGSIVRLTNDDALDFHPRINNPGAMVWIRGINNKEGDRFILYADGNETVLDKNAYGFAPGSINDLGHAVWSRDRRGGASTTEGISTSGMASRRPRSVARDLSTRILSLTRMTGSRGVAATIVSVRGRGTSGSIATVN